MIKPGWRVHAIEQLLEVEQLDVPSLAVRAGWRPEEVQEVLEAVASADEDAVVHLLACFGLNRWLHPFDDSFRHVAAARGLTAGERYARGRDLSVFADHVRVRDET